MNILVTLDSLHDSGTYLEKSFKLIQKLQGKQVLLLDVVDTAELETIEAVAATFDEELVASKKVALAALVKELQGRYPALAITGSIKTGNPKSCIVKAAKDSQADLVISGSHHYSNVEYLLYHGSVSAYLAKHLPCDLFIIKNPAD